MADPLSFGSSLDPQQQEIAKKIIQRAMDMGIDPRLAVSIAYQESRLRADVGKSPKGAIGIMQVMPKTGKDYGFSKEDLMDPDRNIEAGLTVLKSYLGKFPEDPRLGVVAYNAGPNHAFFTGGEMPEETKNYLRSLNDYGAFTGVSVEAAGEPTMTEEDISDTTAESIDQSMADQEARQAELYGAGAGSALAAGRGVRDVGGAAIEGLGERAAMGAQRALQPTPITGGMQPPAAPMGAPEPPVAGPAAGGRGTFNYGKAFGLGDIEAGRATAMGGGPGSAVDMIRQRTEALERLKGMAPATGMAEDPTRGGLMVPQQTPYTGPRGPEGQIGGAKPPPVSPVTPKPAGALEDVTNLLRKFATTPLFRYAVPAAGGAIAGGEFTRAAQEMRKEKPDYASAGLSGLSGLGAAMSLFPGTAPVGIPLSLGAGALQFGRERARENEARGFSPDVIPSNPMGDFGF